jgi:Prokaryotic N-terminal methylation motif
VSTPTTESEILRAGLSRGEAGFTLIELLLGLFLALCLALGVAPVWVSFQSLGVRESDETIWTLQGRVAIARLEKDLRLAGADHCPFATGASVLDATPTRVVFLTRELDSTAPVLVEWELVNGSLMRRWGPCPGSRPSVFIHSLYSDNKTMLEGADPARSAFSYTVAGKRVAAPISATDLLLVDSVDLVLNARPLAGGGAPSVKTSALVGR